MPRRPRMSLRTCSPAAAEAVDFPAAAEAVALAADKTILKCHELKWPYCNGILKRWHEAGLHTPEEIQSGDRPAPGREDKPRESAWKYV